MEVWFGLGKKTVLQKKKKKKKQRKKQQVCVKLAHQNQASMTVIPRTRQVDENSLSWINI